MANYKRINTYKGTEIIGVNFQNIKTGEVVSEFDMYKILMDDCDWCNSTGYLESYGEKIKCPHCDLDNFDKVIDRKT